MNLPQSLTTVTPLSKALALSLFVSLPFIGFYFGYQYHQNFSYSETPPPEITPSNSPSQIPTVKPYANTSTTKPKQGGADLEDIRYALPPGWEAKFRDNGLFISPADNGGYFFIKVYKYAGDVGRREYFCQLVGYCIEETYFTEVKIGNTSGYMAQALDNSGGGSDLFATKGDKFYIINSISPPSPNEFDKSKQSFLNSLLF